MVVAGKCFSCCWELAPGSFLSFSNELIPDLFTPAVQPFGSTQAPVYKPFPVPRSPHFQGILFTDIETKNTKGVCKSFVSSLLPAPSIPSLLQQPANANFRLGTCPKCDFYEGTSAFPSY